MPFCVLIFNTPSHYCYLPLFFFKEIFFLKSEMMNWWIDDDDEVMNCFCDMVDRWKAFSLISSWDHCQRFSPSWISDTSRAGFEPAQNLNSGFVEWSCAVVITTTEYLQNIFFQVFQFRPATSNFQWPWNIDWCKRYQG